ncbi:MAG: hypothetical protein A2126_03260 [Candidatus Woykebacteria bacterium GWB1_45_5]|uniref:ComEC/Rec2-related protein n=2 Tax=Microgenomates group TaxID=1794810 RepID=A0A0G1MVN0_9BACT|nr:MAG: ComEC/Rec2-related protein [Candidatus Woesebacteria bacterium GW2011_GWA1_45_8]OGY22768.1 MAG: hypothetical protein A2126_03260 [Candidatus Woykebacteria bacterium GWB1_45_5]
MKKSKTKLRSIKKVLIVFIIFGLGVVFFWRLFSIEQPKQEGDVKFSATLLQVPKIYDRWQYFDIEGYGVRASSDLRLSYGDKLEIEGVAKEGRLNNPKINVVGSSGWQENLFNLRERLKEKITAALPEPQAALLAGILLGAKEELPVDFKESLRKTGTIHVVVVSGYNISVVAGFLIGLSRFIRRQYAIFLGLVGIAFYTFLVGADAPAVRAAIMGSAAFLATLAGRQRFPLYFLFLAAFVMLLVKPTIVEDVGFQLSFLATAGIIFFQEKILRFFKFVPKAVSDNLATTLAAQSLVVPVIFYHFGSVSAISPLANAALLWIIPIATIFGFVFLAISLVIPFLATVLAWILWAFLTIFVFLVEGFAKVSFAYLSFSAGNFWPALLYYAALVAIIFYLRYVRMAGHK